MKLLQGDCLIEMKNIPDNSIDLILTDPPYGTTACKWDSIIPLDKMWLQLKRIIKDNGAIVLSGSQPFTTILISSNMDMFKYCWVWEKDQPSNFALANVNPMKYHEDISIFYKKLPTFNKQMTEEIKPVNLSSKNGSTPSEVTNNNLVSSKQTGGNLLRNPKSIIKFNKPKPNSIDNNGYHPTQKPVKLMEYLIKTYTNENEIVLDFTMGSGTTGVACKQLNRDFIGIELDKKYFKIAEKRIKLAVRQDELFTEEEIRI